MTTLTEPVQPSLRASLLVLAMSLVGGALYFLLAVIRYQSFRAGSDLGIFDQASFLISRGLPPVVDNMLAFHILADHGAVNLYGVAQLYRIYPTVYWLLAVQSLALALGAWPVWRIAIQARLPDRLALTVAVSYLAYPAILGAVLFDFHPESLAVPTILMALLCAAGGRTFWFAIWILVALPSKEPVSLATAATGVWLIAFERKTLMGCIAIVLGGTWFLFVTQFLIPHFGHGLQFNSLRFLSQFGSSYGQIFKTFVLSPQVPLKYVLTKSTVIYLLFLIVPVGWGLSVRSLAPMIGALPVLAVNLLSNNVDLRAPFNHYAMIIVPFVFMSVVATLAANRGLLHKPRSILVWIAVLAIVGIAARAVRAGRQQTLTSTSNDEKRRVIAMVDPDGGVLTTHAFLPHLSHRKLITFLVDPATDPLYHVLADDRIDTVLLDYTEDSVINAGEYGRQMLLKYEHDPRFELAYHNSDLYLFRRRQK